MTDAEAVAFLQRVLPTLGLRWRGFKNVRRQVVRRIATRTKELGLDATEYEALVLRAPAERAHLDSLCFVTISRFYRDREVYDALRTRWFPEQQRANDRPLRVWSAGCANGEEPYTIAVLAMSLRIPIEILATDRDEAVLTRARAGRYESGSMRELPDDLRALAFDSSTSLIIKPEIRQSITFAQADIRTFIPDAPLDMVFARNLPFTYFDEATQRLFLDRIRGPGRLLVVGSHEAIPHDDDDLITEISPCVYRFTESASR